GELSIGAGPLGEFRFGPAFTALTFENNERFFTFGHGGYFSPQRFFHGAAVLRWQRSGTLRWESAAEPGYDWYQEAHDLVFPRSPRSFHESAPIQFLRQVLVVGAADQPDAVDIVFARPGKSFDVIELQRLRRAAPAAALVHERAAPAIALVDRALDRVGNVARGRRLGRLGARRSWTRIADLLSLPGRHARCRPRPAPHPEP